MTNTIQSLLPQTRPGVDPASVESRQRAMVLAGTHPMIADRLARDAAANQVLRERHGKAEPETAAEDDALDFKA